MIDEQYQVMPPTVELHTVLTERQHRRLIELEQSAEYGASEVLRGQGIARHGIDVMGRALTAIKDENLFVDYGTWADYVPQRFGMTPRRADQVINAWRKKRILLGEQNTEQEVLTERALRVIPDDLPAPEMIKVWATAEHNMLERGGKTVTSHDVRQAVADVVKPDDVREAFLDTLLRQAMGLLKKLDKRRLRNVFEWLEDNL